MIRKPLVPLFLVILLLAACSQAPLSQGHAWLSDAGQQYDILMTQAGDAWKSGKITDAQKSEIIRLGTVFRQNYRSAVFLESTAKGDTSEASINAFNAAAAEAKSSYADLYNYIRSAMP